jgi:hypothetical protein
MGKYLTVSRLNQLFFTGLSMFILLAMVSVVGADPGDVHLTSSDDYEKLRNNIIPVTQWNEGLEGLHPGKRDSFRPSQVHILDELMTNEGTELDKHPGVLMGWGTQQDTGEIIAAWDLTLPVDPDLTDMCITLTAWPRTGMTSISFSLKDVNGIMKGWSWPVGAGGLPVNVPTTLTVNASGGAGQVGATGYWDGGIDLTKIVAFEFDESGIAQGGIPLPNNLTGFVGQWNYWHDIIVTKCPPARPEHFTCYKVYQSSQFRKRAITLVDQFTPPGSVLDARVIRPVEICAPVNKNNEGVKNAVHHLVCYEVITNKAITKVISVKNQFGEQKLGVKGRVQRLCVPSFKKVLN